MGRAFEYRKARKLKRWGNMSRTFSELRITVSTSANVVAASMSSARSRFTGIDFGRSVYSTFFFNAIFTNAFQLSSAK